MMQHFMSNPDLVQQMIMANPQMRALIDQNPQLAHVFNDRDLLRQSLQVQPNNSWAQDL